MGTCYLLQNTFYWPGTDGLEIIYGEKTDFWRYWKNISREVAKFYQIWNKLPDILEEKNSQGMDWGIVKYFATDHEVCIYLLRKFHQSQFS